MTSSGPLAVAGGPEWLIAGKAFGQALEAVAALLVVREKVRRKEELFFLGVTAPGEGAAEAASAKRSTAEKIACFTMDAIPVLLPLPLRAAAGAAYSSFIQ